MSIGSNKKNYYHGIFFLLLMMLTGCFNDVIAKFIGKRLDSAEIIFFRFFFSLITILPFIVVRGAVIFKTSNWQLNVLRGFLGAIAFYLYTHSLMQIPMVEIITIMWAIPLFIVVLSILFLKERVNTVRWTSTLVGFFGLAFITLYDSGSSFSFKFVYIIPVASAFLFALQDIMVKKMLDTDDRITMLLYFAIVSSFLTFIPAIFVWKTPTLFELSMLLLLGFFANLMQFFIFRAFEAADLSALAPFRYVEFLLSALMGFIFFGEIAGLNVLIGAIILVPSTLYLAYSERRVLHKREGKK
ncbi:MAG: DMT family transporter [Holosporaceae bacterium]|jgi:S-adenosylmethionine uptake transporter|nr:DMT family transporter [Holosporaceae bacterium]